MVPSANCNANQPREDQSLYWMAVSRLPPFEVQDEVDFISSTCLQLLFSPQLPLVLKCQGLVVQRVDNFIQQINLYQANKVGAALISSFWLDNEQILSTG